MELSPERKKSIRHLVYFLILVALYAIFMTIAALVMLQTEENFEKKWREKMRTLKNEISDRDCISREEVEDLIKAVEEGNLHGFSAMHDVTYDANNDGWTFGSALLFVVTIGTTVGYGHLSPGTEWGKAVVSVLTVVSVPLTLLLTTVMVVRLLYYTRQLRTYLLEQIGERLGMFVTRLLHLFIIFFFVLTFFVLILAVVFREAEPHWGLFDALYFSIVSVSTVGLGDYVPGLHMHGFHQQLYLVFCSVFLVVGVVFVLLVLETMYEIPELGIHVYLLPANLVYQNGAGRPHSPDNGASNRSKDKRESTISQKPLVEDSDSRADYGSTQ